MFSFSDHAPLSQQDWPHDQSYRNICACGQGFSGPKRAPSCWECQSENGREWWHSTIKSKETDRG